MKNVNKSLIGFIKGYKSKQQARKTDDERKSLPWDIKMISNNGENMTNNN